MLFTLHHIVFDGWSLGVLAREMGHLYEAYVRGQASSLPELPIQYADFALWQHRSLQGGVLARHREYWVGRLAGAPRAASAPTDRLRAGRGGPGLATAFTVSPTLSATLRTVASQEGVTPFVTLLAGFVALLHRYTGEDDIVVGSPIASRTRVELEKLIGFFANTLVLRTDVSGEPTFREFLGRVREATLGAFEHQDMPFEKLVEDLQPERALGQNPLFQVVRPSAGTARASSELRHGGSPFDLSLSSVKT